MRILSKSKLLAFRQCPKRLWLEIHQSEQLANSAATQASFALGHQVGDIAQQLYDPKQKGVLLNPQTEGFEAAFARTQTLLQTAQPIFEAGFQAAGARAFADVLLPIKKAGQKVWRMVEVKSATSVKDYHRDDVAIQAYVAKAAGVSLAGVALAHINSAWVYPGGHNYQGLLLENDLTAEAFAKENEVKEWLMAAQTVAAKPKAPAIRTGQQCSVPYACGFWAHCQSQEPQAEQPIDWLPGAYNNALAAYINTHNLTDMRDVPAELLNERQQRVKAATLSGQPYFDQHGAAQALAPHKLPAYFMDFETIQFAVPIWQGTRPYQQIAFQFSVHHLTRSGTLTHQAFLDLSGKDPSQAFAQALLTACGKRGPIFVYNQGFEKARISELAQRLPQLATALQALNARVVDLWPVARDYYYHPSQHGSWSIKAVLPALCPELNYNQLDGVQDGNQAMAAYLEALAAPTSDARKAQIKRQLHDYCALDTYAMLRMWAAFTGKKQEYEYGQTPQNP